MIAKNDEERESQKMGEWMRKNDVKVQIHLTHNLLHNNLMMWMRNDEWKWESLNPEYHCTCVLFTHGHSQWDEWYTLFYSLENKGKDKHILLLHRECISYWNIVLSSLSRGSISFVLTCCLQNTNCNQHH